MQRATQAGVAMIVSPDTLDAARNMITFALAGAVVILFLDTLIRERK